MRLVRQQVANTVDVMQTGHDPLVRAVAAVNHRPHRVRGKSLDDLKVFTEGFKPVAAPDVEACRWMLKRSEVDVIDILMKDSSALQLVAPMWRQCFVPRGNCFDLLNQAFKRAKRLRCDVLCARAAQGVEGMPNMVVRRWTVGESP